MTWRAGSCSGTTKSVQSIPLTSILDAIRWSMMPRPHPATGVGPGVCVGAANKAGFFCWNRYTGELYWKVMLTNANPSGPNLNSTAAAYNRFFVVSNSRNPKGNMSVSAALHV